VKKDGPNVDIETYSFLTTTPNPLVAAINHERMPVLLTREEEFQAWLTGSPDEAFALAMEYAPDQLRIVQEGFDKEDLRGAPSPLGRSSFRTEAILATATLQSLSAGNDANPKSRLSQLGAVGEAPFRPHLEHRAQWRSTSLEASPRCWICTLTRAPNPGNSAAAVLNRSNSG
jgi:hypothetical protein